MPLARRYAKPWILDRAAAAQLERVFSTRDPAPFRSDGTLPTDGSTVLPLGLRRILPRLAQMPPVGTSFHVHVSSLQALSSFLTPASSKMFGACIAGLVGTFVTDAVERKVKQVAMGALTLLKGIKYAFPFFPISWC